MAGADHGGVDVADVRDDAIVPAGQAAHVLAAPALDADDGHVEPFIGVARRLLGLAGRRRLLRSMELASQGRGQAGRALQKIASIQKIHRQSPCKGRVKSIDWWVDSQSLSYTRPLFW